MPPTQLVLFGAGVIGKTHIDRIQRHPDLTLAGIADPTPAGKTIAQSLGVAWAAEPAELLDQVKPQGAIVATPNATHVPVALACLERGIPALVEKPVADTVTDAFALVDAVARSGTPVLVGHHRRHNPIIQRARTLVANGQLGQIVSATALASFLKPNPYFDVAWRRQAGGGPILINLIHDIDMLRFLLGEVTEVQAMDSHAVRNFEVEDTAAAVLRFASGALATVIVSDAATSPWCWDMCAGEQGQYPRQDVISHQIMGTHGSLSLPDLGLWHYRGERSWHAELTHEASRVHAADPYTRQLEHFAAVIAGHADPICSALDGMRTLAATLAVHNAATSGQTIQLENGYERRP
jgi:predicted dehydrogenase